LFGGNGGASTDNSNIAGGGGGGGGLGGAIFAWSGSLRLERVHFSGCAARRGTGGTNSGNAGEDGFGKGGAVFVGDNADVRAHGLTFTSDDADDANGSGYTPGVASDTLDVFGVIKEIDPIFANGFDGG
jgi:hypothetical protein